MNPLDFAFEIAFKRPILPDSKLIETLFGQLSRDFGGDLAGVRENVSLVEGKESIEPRNPVGHLHWDLTGRHIFGVKQILLDNPIESLDFRLDEAVLRDSDIAPLNLALGGVLPRREAHTRFGSVGPVRDDLSGRLSGNGPMELVLNGGEKRLGQFGFGIVVDTGLFVEIGDLELEAPFACPDLSNTFDELIEVVLPEPPIELESLIVEHETFYYQLFQGLGRLNPKLSGLSRIDPVDDRNNGVEGIVLYVARHLPIAFHLNDPEIPDRCLRR